MRLLKTKKEWGSWVLAAEVFSGGQPPKEFPCFAFGKEEETPTYLYRSDIEQMAQQIAKVKEKKSAKVPI